LLREFGLRCLGLGVRALGTGYGVGGVTFTGKRKPALRGQKKTRVARAKENPRCAGKRKPALRGQKKTRVARVIGLCVGYFAVYCKGS